MTPEEKLQVLQECQNSSRLQLKQKNKEQQMINELLTLKKIFRDAKQCPVCKMAVSRVEGCNKMVCRNCGTFFRYRCNQKIDGYDHFRDGACDLFRPGRIQRGGEQLNGFRMIAQAQEQINLIAGNPHRPCPTCHQAIAKLGTNNHIYCWSCQKRFCFLCGIVVRRPSEHFGPDGPNGCFQHSTE